MEIKNIPEGTWPDAIPDKLISPCSVCGCRVDFDYHVDDDFWNEIVPYEHKHNVVCFHCLDIMATSLGENICDHVQQIYYCGEKKTMLLNGEILYLYEK